MGTAGEGEGKCAGLLVSELSLACSVFLHKIFFSLLKIRRTTLSSSEAHESASVADLVPVVRHAPYKSTGKCKGMGPINIKAKLVTFYFLYTP
jgi:hypothetical protein